ncbi:uncharacterized protein LOC143212392 [Lasioglossum baleicum]|uniref:uncharacterized protein LOC143212392 n=1 Tax=Lasioglossum baleicum TaxID=434251 RepID=UPI003FCE96D1
MNFRWKKRATRVDETDGKNYDDLPLNLLEVYPERGVLSPTSEHYFTVTVESKDLRLKHYSAVLQLYVEDIPLAAISQELELHTEACTNRQRTALSSVDVWVAGIEVRLQCDIDDDSRTDTEVSETFESLVESTSSYEYCVWDKEDIGEVCCETPKHSCLCKLMREELFSHYDILNLKQFEPLLWEHIISVATIRPTRALYIGIEETYVFLARNLSDKSVKFSWGEVNGADAEMLKLCVCPQNGAVAAKNTKIMKITVVPVKEGIVQFLHIPCFINDTQKIIMLAIECFIEPLHVAFYFPKNDRKVFQWKTSFTRVEWRVDNSRMDFDMTEECKEGMKLLDKYKMQEERELMNMNLDQGDVLKDASMCTSATNVGAVESRVESSLSTRTSEIIKTDNFTMEEGNYAEENEFSGHMVPFSETTLPSSIQPVVIEFSNVSLRKVEKKTFIIKNGTAIPTNFWISVKNFYPVQCSCERQIIEDRIKFMFKQAFGKDKNIIEESLYRAKQPDSGIIIHVDPLSFNLDPFAAVPVDIYVFADTWGVYIDELEISITGLPRYTLAICVQVVGQPISLSIAQTSSTTVPVLNYGLEPMGRRLLSRTVLIKNTSVIPIAIDWHVILIKPVLTEKIPPINIIYDICTPFTNQLSKELKNSRFQSNTESKIPNTHDFISINNDGADTLKTSSDISEQRCVKTEGISTWQDEEMHDSEKVERLTMIQRILAYFRCRQVYEKNDTSSYIDAEQNEIEKKEREDIECRISVLPYYGEINNNVCTVTPKEMFTMPNHSAAIKINIYPERCVSNGKFEGEFVCKVLGFLRIAPSDKHQDNQYCRLDGLYLSPIEFDVAITVVQPLLLYDIPKANKTFICCINDVMNTKSKRLELSKSFFFYNNKGTAINVILETYYPFHVKSTSIFTECKPYIPKLGFSIHGHGCAEVEIICKVDHQLIHTILHTSKAQELRSSIMTLKEPLFIVYPDDSTQELELNLQIWIPSLKLSTYTLNFSTVYVNETKKLTLVLENLSMSVYQFKVKGKHNNKDFAVDQNEGKLLSKHAGSCYYTLTISFQPK